MVAGSDGVTGLQSRLAGVAGFLDRYLLPLVLIVAGLGVALPARDGAWTPTERS